MKSIRTKLIFWASILFIFIGALIYFPLSNMLPKMITSQILKRDVEIARFLSNEIKEPLLTNNKLELSLLLNDNLERIEDAHYLFIQGPDGTIISHTFTKDFPKGLLSFRLDSQQPYKIKEFLNNDKKMYDIAYPVLEGELGTLHLGVSLESGKKDIAAITKINYYVAGVILIGLGIGIFIFFIMGFLFSNKIIKLKNFIFKISKGELDAKVNVKSKDEIGSLALAFNDMAFSLKEKIEEIKRLNTIEERHRIAIDLHDSCAQDLANIIKRLELCERLFKINQHKGFEELSALRDSTNGILDKTRQVIFGLKSQDDVKSNLVDYLNNYITDYQRQNDINVKLYVSASINNISPDNSKSIFYIVKEALTNVRKHSQAKNVALSLELSSNKDLMINIEDDGEGFDTNDIELFASTGRKLGLVSMRQRTSSLGGTFRIDSKPQQGTKISVKIPFNR